VCCAGLVVRDVARYGSRVTFVAQAVPDLGQLGAGQDVEEHESVCLLGQLVPVRGITFGLEYPVQASYVAVTVPVGIPVELFEVAVALELAEDPLAVEAQPHPAGDVIPTVEFLAGQFELL